MPANAPLEMNHLYDYEPAKERGMRKKQVCLSYMYVTITDHNSAQLTICDRTVIAEEEEAGPRASGRTATKKAERYIVLAIKTLCGI